MIGLAQSRSCAMLHGEKGLGNWQGETELLHALERRNADKGFRVFAVQLPGAEAVPEFLQPYTTLDLTDAFDQRGELTPHGLQEVLRAVAGKTRREMEEQAAAQAPPPRAGAYRALFCGVADYASDALSNLHSPVKDVEHLADALIAAGAPAGDWQINRRPDLTYEQLQTQLIDLFSEDASPDDTLLFYFSGHGLADHDASYVCAANTNPSMLSFTAIPETQLVDLLRNCPGHKIIILDCCQGARLRHSAFEELDDQAAVVVATQGMAEDGSHDSELSPFTGSLIEILQDPAEYGHDGLEVGHLVQGLKNRGTQPWTNGLGTKITLASAAVETKAVPEAPEPKLWLEIPIPTAADERRELERRLTLLKQLGMTVDGLLAMADDGQQFPSQLVNESVELLTRELCQLMSAEHRAALSELVTTAEDPVKCAIGFEDRELFGDLPWEYLALHLDQPNPGLSLQRTFSGARLKSYAGGRAQNIGWFSSMEVGEPATGRVLTTLAAAQLHMTPTRPVTYPQLVSAPDEYDGVILQTPVELDGKDVKILVAEKAQRSMSVPADKLANALRSKTRLSWVFIETMADRCNKQAALALRRLTAELAEGLDRPVVAVSHPHAYVKALEGEEPPPVFLVELMKHLKKRVPLDQATYLAREHVVQLSVLDPSMVGVPIIMVLESGSAEPRGGAARPRPGRGAGRSSVGPSRSGARTAGATGFDRPGMATQ